MDSREYIMHCFLRGTFVNTVWFNCFEIYCESNISTKQNS